jgi:hypothetical protein
MLTTKPNTLHALKHANALQEIIPQLPREEPTRTLHDSLVDLLGQYLKHTRLTGLRWRVAMRLLGYKMKKPHKYKRVKPPAARHRRSF